MFSKIKVFIPLAVLITCVCGLIELAVQQNYRQSANDPQIQMSEDSAAYLAKNGNLPFTFPETGRVNMRKSLSTFLIEYDESGKIVNSTGDLDGNVPPLPKGVLDYAGNHGQNILTWQPDTNVRIAAVVTQFQGKSSGFVLAGRNLREIEKREQQLEGAVGIGWAATLVATFVATLIFLPNSSRKKS